MSKKDYVHIGNIVNTHGLRGELRILSDSDFKSERFVVGKKLTILDQTETVLEEVEIAMYRTHKNFDLLTFKGYGNINQVEKFKGKILAMNRAELTDIAGEDTFYAHDIQQCDVIFEDVVIGKVYKIVATGAYDLWYIRRPGKKDLLLPFRDAFVKDINIAERKIYVELLDGMDDMNKKKK